MTATGQRDTGTLKVLMIDFNPVVREGLQTILMKDETIEVIGDVPDGHEALQRITCERDNGRNINVVLMKPRNGKVDGVQSIRLIKDKFPEVAVLVLAENVDDTYVIDAIHAGAGGYVFFRDMTTELLRQSIHRLVEDSTQMTTTLLYNALEHLLQNGQKTIAERTAEAAHLTKREVDVLRLLGNGDSNKTIAKTLGITLDTTRKHIRKVIEKLQARGRVHAAIIAAQAGILVNPVATVI